MRRILILLMLFGCEQLMAQGLYINGAVLSVSTGTVLSVPDSIVNKGTLINNGDIIIAGAWINSGTYNPGAGQVTFDSDLDQVINHNAQSIEKLVITGGGKKEFLADIFVQSALTLSDGHLVSKNGARIVMESDVTITGGSDASHVQGPVERKGSGTWVFPIGNGTTYLPVEIGPVNDANAFGIITLHQITTETLTTDATLERISGKRYFEFVSSGNLANATINISTADDDISGELTIGASNSATGPYSNLGASAPTFKFYAIAAAQSDLSIEVFNAVSAGGDGKNDFMEIRNIQHYPNNRVVIHNRWGDQVYQTSGYDNNQNVFRGVSDNGNKLPAGTYFYSIDLGDGSGKITGYLVVR